MTFAELKTKIKSYLLLFLHLPVNPDVVKSIILIVLLIGAVVGLVWVESSKRIVITDPKKDTYQIPKDKETTPYVKSGLLYTSLGTIPLKSITRVEIVKSSRKYVIIEYRLDKYRSGMLTMSYSDFLKVEKYFRK